MNQNKLINLKDWQEQGKSNAAVKIGHGHHYDFEIKSFISNNSDPKFEKSKRSLYCMLAGPSLTLLTFQIFSPFSIFRKIGINGMIFGTIGCFTMSIVDDLDIIARKEKG